MSGHNGDTKLADMRACDLERLLSRVSRRDHRASGGDLAEAGAQYGGLISRPEVALSGAARTQIAGPGGMVYVEQGGSSHITLHLVGSDGQSFDVPAFQGAIYVRPFARLEVTVAAAALNTSGVCRLVVAPEGAYRHYVAEGTAWQPFEQTATVAGNATLTYVAPVINADLILDVAMLIYTADATVANRNGLVQFFDRDLGTTLVAQVEATISVAASETGHWRLGAGMAPANFSVGTNRYDFSPLPDSILRIAGTAITVFDAAYANGVAGDTLRVTVRGRVRYH